MRLKLKLSVLLFFLLTFSHAKAQSYQQLWKEVESHINQDLPQSASNTAKTIFQKAQAERNSAQMMKAYLTLMEQHNALSVDSFCVDMRALEAWAKQPNISSADAAVLYSILGELYEEAATKGKQTSYNPEVVPHNMNEWTQLNYRPQSFEAYALSTPELSERQGITTDDSMPLINTGKWSHYFKHSLAHFIVFRAVKGYKEMHSPHLANFYTQPVNSTTHCV